MIQTEQDYLDAIVNGDLEGLDLIYSKFLPPIIKVILRSGGKVEDAQDVFQDALMILYEKGRRGDLQIKGKFYSYLLVTCRNLWGNRIQKKSFKEVTIPEQIKHKADKDLEALILQEEEEQIFWSAFDKLKQDCQQILRLFFDKTKMEKIREIMGFKSVAYTKKRKHQCKEKLIEYVKADERYLELLT